MEIPLFPLHTVLCPGIALPLHIFEPRYRLMIERCIEQSKPFGIVVIRNGREVGSGNVAIAGVGTFAEIREATRLPDGRYDILVVGSGRFAVETVDTGREPYLVAEVTGIDDEVGDLTTATSLAARTMRRFVAYLQLLQPMEGETAEEIDVRVEIETEEDPTAEERPAEASAAEGKRTPREPGTEPSAKADATETGKPEETGGGGADAEREARLEEAARRLVIPEDPTVLSYLLSGIIQVDTARRQQLLEAETTEDRLIALDRMLDRELWMLRRRLRFYNPDARLDAARRN
jgi:Lon protease-like protein